MVPLYAFAAEDKVLLELNTIEPSENRCRLNFVIENRSEVALDTLKLDLVLFSNDGAIMRRLITDMAPVRPMKTMVELFWSTRSVVKSARFWSMTSPPAFPAIRTRASTSLICRRTSRTFVYTNDGMDGKPSSNDHGAVGKPVA